MKKLSLYTVIAATLFFSCDNKQAEKTENMELYTINTDWLDLNTNPADDFYQFATGTWDKNTEIPSSESRWGSFNVVDQENKRKLTLILDEAVASENEKGSSRQIIGDYYQAMKDMETRNAKSAEKIGMIRQEIENIDSKENLANVVLEMNKKGINAFYGFYVEQDMKNIDNNIFYLTQGGLGLPNRDYYFDEDKAEIRAEYQKHITRMFTLYGYENSEEMAKDAYQIELDMAKTMMTPAEARIPENTYHPTSIEEAEQYGNFVNVAQIMETYAAAESNTIIVEQPEHFKTVSQYIQGKDLGVIRNYIAWKYLDHYAATLNEELLLANFDFFGKVLSGAEEMKPINERAIEEMTWKAVREALAQEFVAHYFTEEAKHKINTLVDRLFIVYENRINNLEWMSDETKEQALNKLNKITRKLAYPDKWRSLEGLDIVPDDYIANIDACARFSYEYNMNKLSQPVDKDEWGMPAHLVNAYYHPLLNEIAFPAGIMQAPFFDVNAEDALNYAGIGMVIGHELTHGFDDMGSKFAADGSFQNWWTEDDRANFEERTKKLGATFAQFCPFDEECVNPDLTMGENIADLGGMQMAFHAYEMTDEYKKGEIREGYTPAQRFFIAYAQLWKTKFKDQELKKRLATDPHSPGKYRVNGPLMNTPEFFEAFEIEEGAYMRKSEEEIARIW